MIEIGAITQISANAAASLSATSLRPEPLMNVLPVRATSNGFASILSNGMASMDAKVAEADKMVAQFALDDSVPLHQVTIALEEARLSVEMAMQVRARMVEGYRELMNMQL